MSEDSRDDRASGDHRAAVVATVRVGDHDTALARGGVLRFGRAGTDDIIGLDGDDAGISRLAGSVSVDGQRVVLCNLSTVANLYLDRGVGTLSVVRPGQEVLLAGDNRIEVRGRILTHSVEVSAADMSPAGGQATIEGPATELPVISLSLNDRRALAAIYSGYLRAFPRRDCVPLSYADAAATLGLPATAVRRRVEHVRDRLVATGVYFDSAVARQQLIEHLLDYELLTPADLELITDQAPDATDSAVDDS